MKERWQRIAARIDELPLRQRAMLLATVSLALVVLAYVLMIEPVLVRQKRLIDQANRNQSQLNAVRSQIESVLKGQGGVDKDPQVAALRELELKVAEAERKALQRKQAYIAPARLPMLLKDLLGPARPVRLEALRTLPVIPVGVGETLYRHGVELTLRGGYFELTQYLTDLEKLPARLLWGLAEMQVEKYPEVRLTLQLHVLSPERGLGL
jgi:MSHA biogenesis protein MshJ